MIRDLMRAWRIWPDIAFWTRAPISIGSLPKAPGDVRMQRYSGPRRGIDSGRVRTSQYAACGTVLLTAHKRARRSRNRLSVRTSSLAVFASLSMGSAGDCCRPRPRYIRPRAGMVCHAERSQVDVNQEDTGQPRLSPDPLPAALHRSFALKIQLYCIRKWQFSPFFRLYIPRLRLAPSRWSTP